MKRNSLDMIDSNNPKSSNSPSTFNPLKPCAEYLSKKRMSRPENLRDS
jgi:hypothetical protein